MSAPVLRPQNEPSSNVMAEIETALNSIDGMASCSGAAHSFVKGEIEMDEAIEIMMSFFTGEIGGHSTERARLIELGQQLRERGGLVPIVLLSFSTCASVLRSGSDDSVG